MKKILVVLLLFSFFVIIFFILRYVSDSQTGLQSDNNIQTKNSNRMLSVDLQKINMLIGECSPEGTDDRGLEACETAIGLINKGILKDGEQIEYLKLLAEAYLHNAYYLSLGYNDQKANIVEAQNVYKKVDDIYQGLYEKYSYDYDVWMHMRGKLETLEEKIEFSQKALLKESNFVYKSELYRDLAVYFFDLGRDEESIAAYEKAIELSDPSPFGYRRILLQQLISSLEAINHPKLGYYKNELNNLYNDMNNQRKAN